MKSCFIAIANSTQKNACFLSQFRSAHLRCWIYWLTLNVAGAWYHFIEYSTRLRLHCPLRCVICSETATPVEAIQVVGSDYRAGTTLGNDTFLTLRLHNVVSGQRMEGELRRCRIVYWYSLMYRKSVGGSWKAAIATIAILTARQKSLLLAYVNAASFAFDRPVAIPQRFNVFVEVHGLSAVTFVQWKRDTAVCLSSNEGTVTWRKWWIHGGKSTRKKLLCTSFLFEEKNQIS